MNYRILVSWLMLISLVWPASISVAQTTTTLTGTVVDASTGKAMPFANVYLNGSTRGTLTNEQGNFTLTSVPLGTVDVVASFVGYQPQQKNLRLTAGQDNRTNFRLKPSEQTLLTITVRANQKKWERHLKQFKRQLLGEPFESQCVIVNSDVLSFNEEKGHLRATATEPLVIENQALGYKLWYELMHFDGAYQQVYYAGTIRFEELKPADERQAKRFRRNRLIAYKGSTRHLMASLVDGTYQKQGFMVYQENADVPPLKTITNRIVLSGSVGTDSTKGHLQPLKLNELIQPGRLPFERRLVSTKPLIVFYTYATSLYSPYIDARFAYSEIKLPRGEAQLTTDGTVTLPNGMEEHGSLSDDRLSRMLPADWQPTQTDADPVMSAPVITQGKLLPPDARQERIAKAFTERFASLAPTLFVHNDKSFYTTGDRLWLSVYLLDPKTNLRLLGETAIHVDLLTPNGALVQHQWLRVTDGRATGNFRLSDSLATGAYRLRAYTDEDDGQRRPAFERSIGIYNLLKSIPPKTDNAAPKPLDIQVLPEGGRWLIGLASRLGIKTTGSDGRGVSVSGRVVDNTGQEAGQFTTNAMGMGSLIMTPKNGLTYYADVHYNQRQQLVPLPPAEADGLIMAVDAISDTNRLALTITGTHRPARDSVYVLMQQRGKLVEQRKILLENGVARVNLSTGSLPPGITQVTLYDATARPQAERLVFLPEQIQPVRVLLSVNKPRFQPRERVILSLNLNDEGLPAVAMLSASITDADQVPEDTAAATIQTHLLLTGELRGRVENPNFYGKDNALATRRALDDLLLTQGWRRVSGTSSMEQLGGVSLMGRILDAKNQPIAGAQFIAASTVPEQSFVRSAGTDDKGRFRLAGLAIADTLQLMTQLADHKLQNYTAKDAHYVLEGPSVSWEADTASAILDWTTLHNQLEAARLRQAADADLYRDKTAKLLKAVTVRARKYEDRPEDIKRMSLHTDADFTLTFDDKSTRFSNLYEMMRGRVPGVNVTQKMDGNYSVVIRGRNTFYGNTQPLYLMDGMYITDEDGNALFNFNPTDIERIEILKNATTAGVYGVRGGNGVIAFYSKRFRPDQLKNDTKSSMVPLQLIGYASVQREFYVPRYDTELQNGAPTGRVDRRDVLYWKPIMQTDSDGHSQLMFPLSDVVRTIRVTVQGITASGRSVVASMLFQVQ